MDQAPEPNLAAKVEFLNRPSTYADRPAEIETVETHFAYVFLSRRFAYKLKKPFKYRQIDLSKLDNRRLSCEQEVVLNRRLAAPTYLGMVALTADGAELRLEGAGRRLDWLVKMRRLPKERSLDRLAKRGEVGDAALGGVIEKLVRFYRACAPVPWSPVEYRMHLEQRVVRDAAELAATGGGLDLDRLGRIRAAQLSFVRERADLVEPRAREGRVVDAHGDLRPEHVFLNGDPQIIDCLEFAENLRWLDAAEEIAFLALELGRLGAGALARRVVQQYAETARDPVPPPLLDFYRSSRAVVRAQLAAWRIADAPAGTDTSPWAARASWYLGAAAQSLGV